MSGNVREEFGVARIANHRPRRLVGLSARNSGPDGAARGFLRLHQRLEHLHLFVRGLAGYLPRTGRQRNAALADLLAHAAGDTPLR